MPGNREVAVGGGADRFSDLPDGILELVLSFLPAADAVRTSVLSRRFRGAWAHAPALNFSDHLLRDLFLGFAREALARYGAPDIPALHVTIESEFNLGPATDAWLRDAMERAVESVSVTVTAPGALHCLTLPRCLRAMSIALRLSGVCFQHCPLVLPEPDAPTSFCGLTELSLSRVRLQERVRPLGVFLSSCCTQLRKLRLSKVSGGLAADGGLTLWPLVLHLDLLEELEVDRVETFTKLQVASSNLRTLGVLSCFESFLQWGMDTVVEISGPRLEDVSWSGSLPKHLSFLNGSHCIRRLSGLRFYLPGALPFN
ncbi:F-box protein At5g03100 isoform X3 [Sorghum bicolor]|uniref:F-box protein At5g03100 isoform X3 n=1 Tax=Sorghum bicolor TaxID=4558 RepID=UPI000B424EF9|nr:F-box protein At5g03100 isoform X3 [Sorghum bicolor]|eukprot:XP_021308927.1 F-box protein At5g03100 isoform X3 [Sorghum bicolor]